MFYSSLICAANTSNSFTCEWLPDESTTILGFSKFVSMSNRLLYNFVILPSKTISFYMITAWCNNKKLLIWVFCLKLFWSNELLSHMFQSLNSNKNDWKVIIFKLKITKVGVASGAHFYVNLCKCVKNVSHKFIKRCMWDGSVPFRIAWSQKLLSHRFLSTKQVRKCISSSTRHKKYSPIIHI